MSYQHQHGGNISFFAKLFNIPANKILDYSANINPLGYPSAIKEAIINNFDEIANYPDPEYSELKNVIAAYNEVPIEKIVLGNGAAELIYLLCHSYSPRKVLIPIPTFSEYALAASSSGAKIDYVNLVEEKGFSFPLDEIEARLSNGYQMLFICNPNNPTGNLFPFDELAYLARACAKNRVLLVVDESFIEFTALGRDNSLSKLVQTNDYLFVLSSLTKILGIPGLRAGYGLCSSKLGKKINIAKDPWNINCFAETAIKIGLADQMFLDNSRQLVQRENKFLFDKLNEIGSLQPYPPTVNYIMTKITDSQLTSNKLAHQMAKIGILIRDCSNFPGLSNKYFRIAVKDRKNNILLINALKSILSGRNGT